MKEIGTSHKNSVIDKNLRANTTYKYEKSAVDTSGNESMKSDTFTVTTKEKEISY
ncbi:TPA: hypothetical protein ROX87_004865 [Bacillus thuringiensis]|uniref:hypothetical protein n=1 Tax=Bacillus thuringiensis TaxID=1428 RepID=UPI00027A9781|nr:hypothetical protein [Bacillus thuringiensis]EJS45871.1 hypothetical protein ICE_05281 [Bacillus cereus BAG1X1-2]EJV74752.1 hypothetical protein IGE_05549 [Bacillus cereus HuB1-1]HDX9535390.1 hypothetical protein [Bacillus thuringiensis]HDX9688877.1 hypothetical protein [Bacillus thuringiensis]